MLFQFLSFSGTVQWSGGGDEILEGGSRTVKFQLGDVLHEGKKCLDLCNNVFVQQGSALCMKLGQFPAFSEDGEVCSKSVARWGHHIYDSMCVIPFQTLACAFKISQE